MRSAAGLMDKPVNQMQTAAEIVTQPQKYELISLYI